jgi:hypothetical protein
VPAAFGAAHLQLGREGGRPAGGPQVRAAIGVAVGCSGCSGYSRYSARLRAHIIARFCVGVCLVEGAEEVLADFGVELQGLQTPRGVNLPHMETRVSGLGVRG